MPHRRHKKPSKPKRVGPSMKGVTVREATLQERQRPGVTPVANKLAALKYQAERRRISRGHGR
jgi:hypothetical protein